MSTDKNNLVYQEQLDDNVIEMLSEDIGSNYSLGTENTRTIVAALNEILGKDIICNAVGSPLLTTDTFAELGEKINVMVSDFKAKLLGLGVSVSSIDKIAVLIEKMGEIDLGVDAEELMAPLEESLREILGDEGVELSGEETLAELIVKVDEEFTDKEECDLSNINTLREMMVANGFNVEQLETIEELLLIIKNDGSIRFNGIRQIDCGDEYNVLLKNDGSVWVCGYDGSGGMGLGSTNTKYLFTQIDSIGNDNKQIACGCSNTFVIKNDGSLWGTGSIGSGQLGLGDTTYKTTFTQVTTNINNDVAQIACGGSSTFILKNDGSLWSCGNNNRGQLGLGDTTDRNVFTQVTTNINNDVKQIVCGNNHTFILKNDGSLWSCGGNGSGQLGLNDTTDRTTFTQVTTNVNNDVKQIACGSVHTFILKNDGSLWSCGNNGSGQLGLNDTTKRTSFTQVTTNINNDVKQVSCACYYRHVLILKNDGSVWACGDNRAGQLGLGDTTTYTSFTQVTTNINNDVKYVACCGSLSSSSVFDLNSFIVKNDNSLWGCGSNGRGQLGLGDTTSDKYTFLKIDKCEGLW